MFNKVFGDMNFHVGWKTKTEIVLWGKVYEIIVDAEAYYENEEITSEQEVTYQTFTELKAEKQGVIESLLSSYYGDKITTEQFCEILRPTSLVINREGGCALLFDDNEEPDNGLAAVIIPDEEIMTQDEYL